MKETGNRLRHIVYGSALILSAAFLPGPSGWVWAQEDPPAQTDASETQAAEPAEAQAPSDPVDPDQPPPAETKEFSPPETAEAVEAADAITDEPPEEAADTVTLEVDTGNVRRNPSLDADVLTRLNQGDTVKVLGTREDWYRIQLPDGDTGWAHQSLFISAGVSLTLTVDRANVRAEPSTRAEIKTRLDKGDTVKVLNSIEDWYQVQMTDGETGWMHSRLFVNPAARRQQAARERHQLEAIRIESDKASEEKAYFIFNGPKPPKTFFTHTGPARVVCNFPNTRLSRGIQNENEVNGELIQNVRIGLHSEDKSDVRVVFDMIPDQEYELEHIFLEGRIYMLIFKKI
jgi:uncharacterized protein YgiM (DUF1202 family)